MDPVSVALFGGLLAGAATMVTVKQSPTLSEWINNQGPPGQAGAAGEKGDPGPAGLPGASIAGPTGPQGATGANGDAGDVGKQGPLGATGAIGLQGQQGPQGPIGSTGTATFALFSPCPISTQSVSSSPTVLVANQFVFVATLAVQNYFKLPLNPTTGQSITIYSCGGYFQVQIQGGASSQILLSTTEVAGSDATFKTGATGGISATFICLTGGANPFWVVSYCSNLTTAVVQNGFS